MAPQAPLNNTLEPTYRDYWGRSLPIKLEYARPVLQSECHVLRYYQVPDDRQALFAAVGDYRQVTVALEPGSFILGFQQKDADGAGCLIQITDIETQHSLWSQPYPTQYLFRDAGSYLLPCPMPVIAPGVLLAEVWAQQTGECSVVMVVAELDKEYAISRGCLVK